MGSWLLPQMLNAQFAPHPAEVIVGHRAFGDEPRPAVLQPLQSRHHFPLSLGRLGGGWWRAVAEGWDRLVEDAAVMVAKCLRDGLALDLGRQPLRPVGAAGAPRPAADARSTRTAIGALTRPPSAPLAMPARGGRVPQNGEVRDSRHPFELRVAEGNSTVVHGSGSL